MTLWDYLPQRTVYSPTRSPQGTVCNDVQPCATTMLRAVRAVLQKMKNPFNASTFGQCPRNDT